MAFIRSLDSLGLDFDSTKRSVDKKIISQNILIKTYVRRAIFENFVDTFPQTSFNSNPKNYKDIVENIVINNEKSEKKNIGVRFLCDLINKDMKEDRSVRSDRILALFEYMNTNDMLLSFAYMSDFPDFIILKHLLKAKNVSMFNTNKKTLKEYDTISSIQNVSDQLRLGNEDFNLDQRDSARFKDIVEAEFLEHFHNAKTTKQIAKINTMRKRVINILDSRKIDVKP